MTVQDQEDVLGFQASSHQILRIMHGTHVS